MIDDICSNNTIKIPISDFLHSIKILRSNLVKYGIQIDFSQVGKMQDSYPLSIFSEKKLKQLF